MSEEEKIEDGKETGENEANEDSGKEARFHKKKSVKIVSRVLAATIALTGAFFGGFFVHKATLPDGIDSLLWAKKRIQSDYYTDISDEEFFDAVFFGVNSLLDDYSGYMTEEEYAAAQKKSAGSYSGLGLYFSSKDENGNDRMLVVRVAGGSPAEEAGIEAGSRIVAFGKNKNELTESEKFADFSEFLSPLSAGEKFFVKELRYPYGADDARIMEVFKSEFTENYVFYRSSSSAYVYLGKNAEETEKGRAISALPEDTAYIRLTQFNGNAAKEFDEAMKRFKADGKKRLILDLRENGGGDMEILCSIASYFCKGTNEKRPVVAKAVYKNGDVREFKAAANRYEDYFGADSKAYVLADSGSASASECLIGCMKDYGATDYENICLSYRAGVAKTFGKGIMQTTRSRYPWTSEAIKLTTAKICWPLSGNCIHGRGITTEDGTKSVSENYAGDEEILSALSAFGII